MPNATFRVISNIVIFFEGLLFNGKYFKVVSQSDGINEARCQFCAPNKRPLRGNVGVSSNFVRHLKMQHPVQHAMYVEEKLEEKW